MKKSVAVLILLVLLMSLMAQPILAAGNSISVSPSAAELAVGESVTLSLSMQSSEACDIFGVILKYDTSVFEVTDGACTASYSQGGESMINFANFSQSVGHEGFAVSCKEAIVYSGSLGYVTLQVKDGAAAGAQTISFATSAKNGASSVSVSAPTVTITIKGSTTVDPTDVPTEPTTEPTAPTEHEHTYASRWYYDKDNHWHECTICGEKKDVKSHTPGPEATETEHQRCTVCNYVITPATSHEHEYSTEWSYNVNQHWHECECGEKSDAAAHSWDKNVCTICGAKGTAPAQPAPVLPTTPSEPETAPTEPEPVPVNGSSADAKWLVGGLILLGIVALVGLLYFVLFKSKR